MKLFSNAKNNHFLAVNKKHKKKAKKSVINKQQKLTHFEILSMADSLQCSPPKSELWFHSLFKEHKLDSDRYNEEFKYSIPDVINHAYKYIIEIDGSIHNLSHIKKRDLEKEEKYKKHGYKVIRVLAYDLSSFETALEVRNYLINRNKKISS